MSLRSRSSNTETSPLGAAWKRFRADKVSVASGFVIIVLCAIAALAPLITALYGQDPYTYHEDLVSPDTGLPIGPWGGADSSHWLGIEPVTGRDILARLIYGARASLTIAILATILSLFLGVLFGVISGYFRGFADAAISRVMDSLLAFPSLLFSLALLAIFQNVDSFLGLSGDILRGAVIIFVLGFFGWPFVGRIVRGQVLSIREKEFIEAARSVGAPSGSIILREILPNIMGPVLVYATLAIPTYILGESGLSFLGVGLQPPTASWGQMLSQASSVLSVYPQFLLWPSAALLITVLAFNLFGDGVRDALDPKSSRS